MPITVQMDGLPEMRAMLAEFSTRRLNNAISTSLTRAAKEMGGVWQDQIDRRVDRPVARTKSATTFTSATANTLQSSVLVKDKLAGTPPAEYLSPQEYAGDRNVKLFEQALQASGAMPRGYFTVPGKGATLDAYGNVSRAQIIAVIAALGTSYSPGYQRVISTSTTKRLATQAAKGRQYLAVTVDEARRRKVSPGIYEETAEKKLRAVFLFRNGVRYRKLLDLNKVAEREAADIIADEFEIAVIESFSRLQRARTP